MACDNYEEKFDVSNAPSKQKVTETNGSHPLPDGGWGWVVCLGVFMVNFLTVGQQNCAGVVYDALMEKYSTSRGETGKIYTIQNFPEMKMSQLR